MKLDTAAFRAAIRLVDFVPYRPGIHPSEFIGMSAGKNGLEFRLASDLVGVSYVPLPGGAEKLPPKFFFDRLQLVPFVNGLDEAKPFDLEFSDGAVVIRQGSRKARYSALGASHSYPNAEAPSGDGVVLDEALLGEVKLASNYAGRATMAPELMAVWFEPSLGGVCATDRFSIYYAEVKLKAKAVIFPAAMADAYEPGLQIAMGESSVCLKSPSGLLFQTLTEPMLKKFPLASIRPYAQALKKFEPVLTFKRGQLPEALTRMRLCLPSAASEMASVEVSSVGTGKLRFHTRASQVELTETVKYEGASDIKAEWLLSSVLPFLASLQEDEDVQVSWEASSPYVFRAVKSRRVLVSARRSG
jgi:hypothetical protein